MDRDTFIITVYCLVDDEYKKLRTGYRVRHAGFAPELSDAEVITMEICGEYFKQQTDKDLFDYFAQHYRHFFPTLSERSLFVRQAANLWQFKAVLQQRLHSSVAKRTTLSSRLIPCRCRCAPTRAPPATGAFQASPTMATVTRKICTTMASSSVYALRAVG